jgi:hypothetical protein
MPVNCNYVRIYVNGAPLGGSSFDVGIAELKILDTNNNNLATGGTPSASTGTASNAFDGNPATEWDSTSPPSSGSPQWLEYQFSSAQNVVAVSIQNSSSTINSSPITFLVQTSPDGTTWTTQATVTSYAGWFDPSQIAYFAASTVVGNARLTQQAIEVPLIGNPHTRLSQQAVETVLNAEPRVKVSQLPFEAILNAEPRVKVSQMALEVIYPNIPGSTNSIQQFLLP